MDIEDNVDDTMSPESNPTVEHADEGRQTQAKSSEGRCMLSQKSLFNKEANTILTVLQDQNFKPFTRRYVLRKILTILNND